MAKLWEQDWILERRRPNHAALAGTALAVSLAIHVALLEAAPSMTWETPIPPPPRAQQHPDIRLREVRREAPPRAVAPQPHDPARPEGALGRTPRPSDFTSALDPVLLQPPAVRAPLAGESTPLAPPAPPRRAEWMPRQERMEVDQKFAKLEIPDHPRPLSPAIPRIPEAPDFALDTPMPAEITPPAPPASAPDPDVNAAMARVSPAGSLAGYSPSGVRGRAGVGVPVRLDDASGLFDERPADITPIEPVERMLRIEVSAWIPADEPEWRYFTLRIHRAGAQTLPVLSKDVLFIMDCSESMSRPRVEAAKPGLREAIARLNPGDRFEVMSFQDRPRRCFAVWTPWDAIQGGRANFFIDRMESSGKTDLFQALEQTLQLPRDPTRPALALLITDGRPTLGLQDYFEIMQRFADGNEGQFSMFTVGSGTQVNRFLLDFLSYGNRGGSTIIEARGELARGIEQASAEIGRPVLTDLRYRFSGLDEQDVFPRQITHLFLDRPLTVHGRVPVSAGATGLRILGTSGNRQHDMVFRLDWARAGVGGEEVRTDWRWQRLNWLIAEHIRTRNPEWREEAIRMALLLGSDMPYAADLGVLKAPIRSF